MEKHQVCFLFEVMADGTAVPCSMCGDPDYLRDIAQIHASHLTPRSRASRRGVRAYEVASWVEMTKERRAEVQPSFGPLCPVCGFATPCGTDCLNCAIPDDAGSAGAS